MIPLRLSLSGFLSYCESVELDFSSFELACISGPNGAGKSSLLDAITWALFGQARKKDDSLVNTHATAAEVVLDFDYEGSTYRIRRSKTRDKPTMLEFAILGTDDGWKPLTERSVHDTERVIQQTLRMDYETFTNASFFLQGKADQFAQQRPGDRKRILSSILGLEVWETYRSTAYDRRKALDQEVMTLAGRLHEIDAELAEEAVRQERLARLETDLDQVSRERMAQQSGLEVMLRLQEALEKQRQGVELLQRQLQATRQAQETFRRKLEERRAERDHFAREVERAPEIEAAYAAWQKTRQELEHWNGVAESFREQDKKRQAPLLEIERERSRLLEEQKTLLASSRSVQAGLAEIPALEQRRVEVEQAVRKGRARLDQRSGVERSLRELHQGQAEALADNPRLKKEMDDLKARITQLGQSRGTCPVCGQPLSPQECQAMVKELETQGKSLGDRYRQNQALIKEFETRARALEAEMAGLASADGEVIAQTRLLDQVASRQAQIEQANAEWQAREAPRLDEITRCLDENRYAPAAMALLAQIDSGLKALGYDAAAHDALRRAELAGRAAETESRKLEVARASLAPLEREIAGLEAQETAQSAEVAAQQAACDQALASYAAASANLPDVEAAEHALDQLRLRENRLRMEVGAARQQVEVLQGLRERRAEFAARQEELNTRISRYRTLERAFSKDGVPALLIEQALPEIETQANDLLDRLSGGAMSVRFATQKEYKDKNRADLKETLDIVISDSVGTRDYEMFSGGEAFRVNFALRLALSRVLSQRAGARLRTLVIDEGFGSQDAEGRQRLIEAINLVKADFAKILVITHLEELKEAFPNRIEVEKGPHGSTVQVI